MASTNTGADAANWQQYGGSGSGGLGSVLGAYLANQAGLIDLKDQTQQSNLQKNGLLSTMLGNQFAPKDSVPPVPTDMTGFQQKSTGGAYPLQMVAPPDQLGSGTYTPPAAGTYTPAAAVNPPAARDTPVSQTGGNPQAQPTGQEWDKYPGTGFVDKIKEFGSIFMSAFGA